MNVPVTHLTSGQTWRLSATGTWTDWYVRCGPKGYFSRIANLLGFWPRDPMSNLFTLTGAIDGQDFFPIGAGRLVKFHKSGELSVFANDVANLYGNNRNAVTLTATRVTGAAAVGAEPVPAPPPTIHTQNLWALLLDTMNRTQGMLFLAFLTFLVGGALALAPEGQDIITSVAQDMVQACAMAAATAWFSFQAWFWGRRIVEVNYGLDRAKWGQAEPLLTWAPRIAGLAPFVFIIATLAGSGAIHTDFSAVVGMILMLLAGVGFFAFVLFREDVSRKIRGVAAHSHLRRGMSDPQVDGIQSFGQIWSIFSVLMPIALLATVLIWPIGPTRWIGPAAVVFLGAASIAPIWTILAQLGQPFRIPSTLVLVVCACLLSLLVDFQHAIGHRELWSQPPVVGGPAPPAFDDYVAAWDKALPADTPKQTQIIVVAAEGGASRAGYWTTDLLTGLQQLTTGRFSQHVLAISSVSGGSVGAVGWVGALRQSADANRQQDIARDFAGADVLSPAMAGMLFPDLLQRFTPAPLWPDRAEMLERGWESAWRDACEGRGCADPDLMAQPYRDIWRADGRRTPWLPLVYVGGAYEECGDRILTGPTAFVAPKGAPGVRRDAGNRCNTISPPTTVPDEARPYTDARDFFEISPRAIHASTAIHNGARFPLISPAGGIHDARGALWGHIVDGGYVDNSGAVAGEELLHAAMSVLAKMDKGRTFTPILILVHYADKVKEARCFDLFQPRLPKLSTPCANRLAQDVASPVETMVSIRNGLQAHIDDNPAERGDINKILVTFSSRNVRVPLDWTLSKPMRLAVDQATPEILTANQLLEAQVVKPLSP
jgi:hypothetical protein